jgi:hypothetical protein
MVAAELELRDLKKRRIAYEVLVFGCLFLLEVFQGCFLDKVEM